MDLHPDGKKEGDVQSTAEMLRNKKTNEKMSECDKHSEGDTSMKDGMMKSK